MAYLPYLLTFDPVIQELIQILYLLNVIKTLLFK